MAIRLNLEKTEGVLFCASKWWGDPDMPENMQYPVMTVKEDGEEYEYPLTFICQINCEDIAPFDKEGSLPHEGMLCFFGAIDELIGYGSPTPTVIGEWPKGNLVVKYAKTINFETFQSCMIVNDEGAALTDHEMAIRFSECNDDEACIRILGRAIQPDDAKENALINLLQISEDIQAGIKCEGWDTLNVLIKASDLKFGNWKKSRSFLNV